MADTTYEFVVFDGDETLVDGDITSALAEHAGVAAEVEALNAEVWESGVDPMEALAERIFPQFEGVSTETLNRLVRWLQFAPGAEAVARNITCQTAIVTALSPLASHVADELDLDCERANTPVATDGVLTSELHGAIVERRTGPVLDALVADLGIDHDQVIAIGDGPHDEPLFTRAGFSIGLDPKPSVQDIPDVVVNEQDFRRTVPYLQERSVLDTRALDELSAEC
ncbi:MAG: haloacid dehalogenase-like hydrolase [Halobellus sp.]|uniref:haloacid dehalogenase-like hydrolase n=1 Tax=Halobellus sp. TaxID=1979212 RepID=UPI0035D4B185